MYRNIFFYTIAFIHHWHKSQNIFIFDFSMFRFVDTIFEEMLTATIIIGAHLNR